MMKAAQWLMGFMLLAGGGFASLPPPDFTNVIPIIVQDNGNNLYFCRDHLGSVREVVDTSGVVRVRDDYSPYGVRSKVSGNLDSDFGFTGHFTYQPAWMADGHVLTLYRIYRPDLGRWLSIDPLGEEAGLNLYQYCANNPVNLTDPLGMSAGDQAICEEKCRREWIACGAKAAAWETSRYGNTFGSIAWKFGTIAVGSGIATKYGKISWQGAAFMAAAAIVPVYATSVDFESIRKAGAEMRKVCDDIYERCKKRCEKECPD